MELVQKAFRDRVLVEEAILQAVVLILKGGDNYHSTSLVEVVWKAVTVILNFCFTPSITYHDSLHGFRSGRSTGTASLEVKLIQKAMAMLEEVDKLYSWTYTRCITPWKGPGSWRLWKDMAWGLGTSSFSEGIGRGYIWWRGR